MLTESSLHGTAKPVNLSLNPSKSIPNRSYRWTLLQLVQHWRVVHGTSRQSSGAREHGRRKGIQSIVVIMFIVFIREWNAHFQNHAALDPAWNYSLVWTPDGKWLFSSSNPDPTIQEWDTVTWKQVDGPWSRKGHAAAGTHRMWLSWPVPEDSLAYFEILTMNTATIDSEYEDFVCGMFM